MIIAEYKSLLPEPIETENYIKKFQFIETKKGWVNGFTEVRKLGYRYAIKSTMAKTYHVSNHEDLPIYLKNFLKLS